MLTSYEEEIRKLGNEQPAADGIEGENANVNSTNGLYNAPIKKTSITTMTRDAPNKSVNNQRAVDQMKRKKLKSRNILMLNNEFEQKNSIGYSKDHLDAWLESCYRDTNASNAHLSSSSEFLELNQLPGKHSFPRWMQQPTKRAEYSNFRNANNNISFELGQQRQMPNFLKTRTSTNNRVPPMFSMNDRFFVQNDDSQEFTSLPPIVDLMCGVTASSENEHNSPDVLDRESVNPKMNRAFRSSEPCLLNPTVNDSKLNLNNLNDMDSNKIFGTLMEQINLLHDTNSKICRNLQETRVDIEALKHSSSFTGMRQRRDSLSGLSTHSQPLFFGSGFGTHSPASTFHSGAYMPGVMTDVVREVKEAARVREDALLNRVKSMTEERQWAMNEGNLRILRDLDELKSHVLQLRLERKETNRRLNHLEAENKYLRQMLVAIYHQRMPQDTIYEGEPIRLTKSNRRVPSFKSNYSTVHEQPISSTYSIEESKDEVDPGNELLSSSTSTAAATGHSCTNSPLSSDSLEKVIPTADATATSGANQALHPKSGCLPKIQSPPSFALVTPDESTNEAQRRNQLDKSNNSFEVTTQSEDSAQQQIHKNLGEKIVAHNKATQRVIAIEQKFKKPSANKITSAPANNSQILNGLGITGHIVGDSRRSLSSTTNLSTTTACSTASKRSQNSIVNKPFRTKNQQRQTITGSRNNNNNNNTSTTKLSVSGPITDL